MYVLDQKQLFVSACTVFTELELRFCMDLQPLQFPMIFLTMICALVAPAGKDKICTYAIRQIPMLFKVPLFLVWGLHLHNSEFSKCSTNRNWFIAQWSLWNRISLHQFMLWPNACSSETERVKKHWYGQAFFITLLSRFLFLSPSTANKLVNVPPAWGAAEVMLCHISFVCCGIMRQKNE